jgi:hypothetical protein
MTPHSLVHIIVNSQENNSFAPCSLGQMSRSRQQLGSGLVEGKRPWKETVGLLSGLRRLFQGARPTANQLTPIARHGCTPQVARDNP